MDYHEKGESLKFFDFGCEGCHCFHKGRVIVIGEGGCGLPCRPFGLSFNVFDCGEKGPDSLCWFIQDLAEQVVLCSNDTEFPSVKLMWIGSSCSSGSSASHFVISISTG